MRRDKRHLCYRSQAVLSGRTTGAFRLFEPVETAQRDAFEAMKFPLPQKLTRFLPHVESLPRRCEMRSFSLGAAPDQVRVHHLAPRVDRRRRAEVQVVTVKFGHPGLGLSGP